MINYIQNRATWHLASDVAMALLGSVTLYGLWLVTFGKPKR